MNTDTGTPVPFNLVDYPPGASADDTGSLDIGDVVLTHGESTMSKLIQFGQKNSFYGNPPEYSWWNHACLVVTKDGDMMEALLTGVQLSHIRRYEERAYKVVHLNLNELDRRQILHFAHSVAQARTRYGVLTIASIVLTLLGGTQLVFGKAGTAICSGFVCEALCRAGFNFPKAPSHMMPGDLAQMFAVQGGG